MIKIRVTFTLLAICIIMFFIAPPGTALNRMLYFDPANLMPWMFVTSIFLHAGFMHILFNGYGLFMFGSLLENRMGEKNYLILFLASGIAGNILYWFTNVIGLIHMPALGASGAIYGILGALSVIEPRLVLLIFGIFPINIRQATILWIIMEFFGVFATAVTGIASAAHLGGLLVGILLAKKLGKKMPNIDMYYWRKRKAY